MRKRILTLLAALLSLTGASAQNDIIISQYIHNRYAVNPAFGGSREGLTFFGSYRKQWTGIENTPQSLFFDTHAPLKKEHLTLGASVYSQSIHQSSNTGVQVSLGYRVRPTRRTHLAFALQGGVSFRSTDWTKVTTVEANDVVFEENESSTAPLLGVGVAWYGRQFFVGAGVVSFFVSDDFDQRDSEFSPSDATYTATAGYLFKAGKFAIQPSVLFAYQKDADHTDLTLSLIYTDFLWFDVGYRTTDEMTAGIAIQALPQLRIAYNYDYNFGDLKSFTSGSHEISIQYDLVYKVKNVGPRFF